MPEGPECRITADQLHKHYSGKTIVSFSWDNSTNFMNKSESYYKFGNFFI